LQYGLGADGDEQVDIRLDQVGHLGRKIGFRVVDIAIFDDQILAFDPTVLPYLIQESRIGGHRLGLSSNRPRKPIQAIFPCCCARAANCQVAAPSANVTKSRRRMLPP